MAKAKEEFLLSPTTTMDEALAALKKGQITTDQLSEWDRSRPTGGKKKGSSKAKSKCPIDWKQFQKEAKPMDVKIGNNAITLEPRQFKSGGFGWGYSGKITIKVGDNDLKVQASINLPCIGSKPE